MTARASFKQDDVARIFKGAKAAGVRVRLRIAPDGAIEVREDEGAPIPGEVNPWDDDDGETHVA
jgi:hypothetical protein